MTEKALLSESGPCWVDRDCPPDENIPEVKTFMSAMDAAAAQAGSSDARVEAITEAYIKFVDGLGSRALDQHLIISLQRAHTVRFDALQSIKRLVAGNLEAAKTFPSAGFKKTLVQALVSTKPTTLAAKTDLAERVFEEFQRKLAGPANEPVLSIMKTELSKWKEKWTAEETAREVVLEFRAQVREGMADPFTKEALKLMRGFGPDEVKKRTDALEADIARNVHGNMKAKLTDSEASGPIGVALDLELGALLTKLGNPASGVASLTQRDLNNPALLAICSRLGIEAPRRNV